MPKSIFRKKIFGYSPKDVSAYIEKINSEAAIEIEIIEKTISNLKAQNERLQNELDANESNGGMLEEFKEKLDASAQEKENLSAEISRLETVISEKDASYEQLKVEFDAQSARFESMSEQADSYASMCQEAGNVLAIAKAKADEMILEAEKKAEVIIVNARITSDEVIAKTTADAKAYAVRIKTDADLYASKVKAESEQQVEHNKEKVEYLLRRQKQLLMALQNQKSEISKFYEETVSGLGAASK